MDSNFLINLEWTPNDFLSSESFDVDLTVFLLNNEGKVTSEHDFIFFNNLTNEDQSVTHSGDNIEQQDGKLKEEVKIKLDELAEDYQRVVFAVSINMDEKNINFGQISNAKLAVSDFNTKESVISYDLTEDFSFDTAIVMGEFEREEDEWTFKSLIQSFNNLEEISERFGLSVR